MRLAALVLALAACGGGGSKEPTTPTGPAGSTAPSAATIAAGAAYSPADEAIGGLTLNLAQDRALEIAGALPADHDEPAYMHGTGEFVFSATWPDKGLTILFSGGAMEGPFTVGSISVEAPNTWATPRGISIGSASADVERMYAGSINTEEMMENHIVVNSVYGGVLFGIADDKVSSIFIGAAAE